MSTQGWLECYCSAVGLSYLVLHRRGVHAGPVLGGGLAREQRLDAGGEGAVGTVRVGLVVQVAGLELLLREVRELGDAVHRRVLLGLVALVDFLQVRQEDLEAVGLLLGGGVHLAVLGLELLEEVLLRRLLGRVQSGRGRSHESEGESDLHRRARVLIA